MNDKNEITSNIGYSRAFPVRYQGSFSRLGEENPGNRLKAKPEMVLTVPLRKDEKRITIQRIPLVIEYLKNNWTWHGREDDDERKPKDLPSSSSVRVQALAQENKNDVQQAVMRSSEKLESGIVDNANEPEVEYHNGSLTDRLCQSEPHGTKRRHLSLAEQALMETESDEEMRVNEQHMFDANTSSSTDSKGSSEGYSKKICIDPTKNGVTTTPPEKYERTLVDE